MAKYIKSVKQALAEMNAHHAVVRDGGRTLVIYETFDLLLKRRVVLRSTFADVRNFFNNRRVKVVTDGGKPVLRPLGDFWLHHAERRQYDGIVFSPGHDVEGHYNLWRGFAVQPKPGDWSQMKAHITEVICRGEPTRAKYVLNWLAFGVQHPDRQAEVALVLQGPQGTGKGLFARLYGELFGPHFVQVAHARHLTGHFNAHLQDAVVIFGDEAFGTDDKQAASVLKLLITEPAIPIERKHRDVITVKNVTHLIIASNDHWVIPAGLDERRFCVLDVGTQHHQDVAYFKALDKQMHKGGLKAMLHDLRTRDLTGVDLRQAPMTEALAEQKLLSMSPVQQWWHEKLMDGRLLKTHTCWQVQVVRDQLHADYVGMMKQSGKTIRQTQTELGLALAKLLPNGFPGENWVMVHGIRQRCWVFPPLPACRAHFNNLTKTQHSWPTESSG